MKKRYKYGLIFGVMHILLATFAFIFLYDPSVPNGDLILLFFPNILIPAILTPSLFNIFNDYYLSVFVFVTIFWILFGFIIGLIVEGLKNIANNMKVTNEGQNLLESVKRVSLVLFIIFILVAIYFISENFIL